jgi:hypothetical protein
MPVIPAPRMKVFWTLDLPPFKPESLILHIQNRILFRKPSSKSLVSLENHVNTESDGVLRFKGLTTQRRVLERDCSNPCRKKREKTKAE